MSVGNPRRKEFVTMMAPKITEKNAEKWFKLSLTEQWAFCSDLLYQSGQSVTHSNVNMLQEEFMFVLDS